MLVGGGGQHPAPGRAHQEAQLQKVGLVHIADGAGVFPGRGGQGIQAHRPAAELVHHGGDDVAVHPVQAQGVHVEEVQGFFSHGQGDPAVIAHLGVVAHALEHPVGDAGRAPAAAGDFTQARRLRLDLEDPGRAGGDFRQLLRGVHFKPVADPKAVAQGGRQHAGPRGGPDQGEPGQVQPDGPGGGALADHDVQGVVLHGGVQHFLHGPGQAVDFVDKQHVPLGEVGQNGRQVSRPVDGRAGGDADVLPHFRGDDAGQRRLAQAGGAVEQDVVQGVVPGQGRLDGDFQVFLRLLLADIVRQGMGAQGGFDVAVLPAGVRGHQSVHFAHGLPP